MNISNSQVNRLRHFVRAGLRSLFRPEPQTAVEWADANYYLPKESAYQEGRWETLPFQRAIMNAMGSDYIREVNVVKSARVGYSKMLLGVYTRRNGAEMSISRICWDTGGIDPTIVYERSKKHGLFRVIPIKGASVYGKPVASMPRKRNKNGVYLTEIGTDTAKEQIYNRFTLTPEGDEPLPGAVHFPNNPDIFDLTEAQQLTAEEQVEKWVDGRKKILWDSKKRRNEALDCFVYALAALRISISRWQLDLSALLASLQEEDGAATNKKTLADYARALSGEDE